MKKIVMALLVFGSFNLLASTPVAIKKCKFENEYSKIEVLHLFASSVLSFQGVEYIEDLRATVKAGNCSDIQLVVSNINKGLRNVLVGMATANGYSNVVDYATDSYCKSPDSPNNKIYCEFNSRADARSEFIFKNASLVRKLTSAFKSY